MVADKFIVGKNVLKVWKEFVENAADSVYIIAYKLTSKEALKSLIEAKERGVNVKMVLDGSAALDRKSLAKQAIRSGLDVEFWPTKSNGKLHTKLSIFDKKFIVIGSFNLTESAELRNTEALFAVDDEQHVMYALETWMSIFRTAFNRGEMEQL